MEGLLRLEHRHTYRDYLDCLLIQEDPLPHCEWYYSLGRWFWALWRCSTRAQARAAQPVFPIIFHFVFTRSCLSSCLTFHNCELFPSEVVFSQSVLSQPEKANYSMGICKTKVNIKLKMHQHPNVYNVKSGNKTLFSCRVYKHYVSDPSQAARARCWDSWAPNWKGATSHAHTHTCTHGVRID